MAYSRTMTGVGVIVFLATAAPASAATLRVDDAAAPVGGIARVAVDLDNPEGDVRALQFSLGPLPAGVEFGDAAATGRAVALTADAESQPDGTVKVVLISLGAQAIAAGSKARTSRWRGSRSSASASQPQVSTRTRSALIQLAVEVRHHEFAVREPAELQQGAPAPGASRPGSNLSFQHLVGETRQALALADRFGAQALLEVAVNDDGNHLRPGTYGRPGRVC